jgi:predicted ATPase
VVLVPTNDGRLIFDSEVVTFHDRGKYSAPLRIELGSGHGESRLKSSTKPVCSWVRRELTNWHVFHFHDTSRQSPMKKVGPINDNRTLRDDGENLAALLFRMRETHRVAYDRIVAAVRLVAPFFDDFALRPDPFDADKIKLEWKQRGSTEYFDGHALSDGTLRFMCIATLLFQPDPPSLILLDEPELGLHPFAIHQLADLLYSSQQQIILSTQSVTLLNQMDIDDVLIAEQHDGRTTLERPSTDGLDEWLNAYSVGEMWEKNLIGGRPVQQ